jgi:hypothetical protein
MQNCFINGYNYNILNNEIQDNKKLLNDYNKQLFNDYNEEIDNLKNLLNNSNKEIDYWKNLFNTSKTVYNKEMENLKILLDKTNTKINFIDKTINETIYVYQKEQNKTNIFIYILELSNNKYYVGKTLNPKLRINQHLNENGSAWTQKYTPIKLLEIIPNNSEFDEDKYTLIYMKNKGIENVRGGSFSQVNLDEDIIKTITKMLKNEDNLCFNCNDKGHFINECPKKMLNNDKELCYNCKEPGHFSKNCKKINNFNFKCEFCEGKFETKNGATYHANHYCKKKKN